MTNRECLERRTNMICDRVLLINIGHFVISCNVRGIFVHKGKNQGIISEEKKMDYPEMLLSKKLGVIIVTPQNIP